jgi:hypothetical protein
MLKLDLGAGAVSPPGFTPMGRAHGTEIYPLRTATKIADESCDEIRASHVLEHFPKRAGPGHRGPAELGLDKLKPGGAMKIAVPEFRVDREAPTKNGHAGAHRGLRSRRPGQMKTTSTSRCSTKDIHWPTRCAPPALPTSGRWDADAGDCSAACPFR